MEFWETNTFCNSDKYIFEFFEISVKSISCMGLSLTFKVIFTSNVPRMGLLMKKITPQKWPCCCHADPCRPWNAIPHPWLAFISGCPQRKISFVIWKCDDCQNLKKKIQKAKTYRLRQAFPKEWYLWTRVDFLEQEWTAVQISLNKSKVVQYPWWRANCLLSKYPETRMHRWIILDEDNP